MVDFIYYYMMPVSVNFISVSRRADIFFMFVSFDVIFMYVNAEIQYIYRMNCPILKLLKVINCVQQKLSHM